VVPAVSVAPEAPETPVAREATATAATPAVDLAAPPPHPAPPQEAASYDPAAELRRIAATYKSSFTQVTGVPSWALGDCAIPPRRVIPLADLGAHADAGSELLIGQKLYYLYVRDASSYRPEAASVASDGQVVVKESWTVREALPSEVGPPGPRSSGFDDARMRLDLALALEAIAPGGASLRSLAPAPYRRGAAAISRARSPYVKPPPGARITC
jgi:hypothetical protein